MVIGLGIDIYVYFINYLDFLKGKILGELVLNNLVVEVLNE